MGSLEGNSAGLKEDIFESTADPNVSIMAEEVPTLTVATILGVALVVLVAIVAVFGLGVLIDWRQQRLLNKKIGEVKRMKNSRKKNIHQNIDAVSIANNMEEPGMSAAPAASLRDLP